MTVSSYTISGPHVLVVDEEPEIRRALRLWLGERGYAIRVMAAGKDALKAVDSSRPDVILLGLTPPGTETLDLCRRIRARWSIPVIVLSAATDDRTKVAALDAGADDYLTEPFGVDELEARIRVALRHVLVQSRGAESIFQSGDLAVDVTRRRVTVRGDEVHLTPTEYDLLKCLVVHAGRVLSHGTLLQNVWGDADASRANLLRYTITQLRKKLGEDALHPRYVLTEPGVGYRLAVGKQGDVGYSCVAPHQHVSNTNIHRANGVPTLLD
jgi:two-component system KDP operon response regulator KdpE